MRRSRSIDRSSVANNAYRAGQAGSNAWPLVPDLDDEALKELLFPPAVVKVVPPKSTTPNSARAHEELGLHKNGTLHFLCDEYNEAHPDGSRCSRCCGL
jgi:hypothetical protein